MKLYPGIYEQVINNEMSEELERIQDERKKIGKIDKAEVSEVLTQYLAEIIEKGMNSFGTTEEKIEKKIDLANDIIKTIQNNTNSNNLSQLEVCKSAEQLLVLLKENDPLLAAKKTAKNVYAPQSSIAQSSLFTGAVHEPQMYTELKKEILTSDRIDMLVSFIKWSGLRLIIDELETFTKNGGQLRIITTSYMGATDVKAVEELSKLCNTGIKVSYDTNNTRLHAKTYVFYRDTGFTTAYVGSSNLSNAALSSGLEWNVKLTQKDLPETIEKIAGSFESYWKSKDFEDYKEDQKERLERALKAEKYVSNMDDNDYTLDISPYSYQQEILDKLRAEREIRGYYRNLVVAATGTGKTLISAFDYRNYRKCNAGANRLLFVAHREEILKQSLYTFRAVLKDKNFGELFVGSNVPNSIDYLFISIQTFNSQDFANKTKPDYYDYIIVDEFHHAAAPSYKKLLEFYKPKILLGLTATPERMDGQNVLAYFNNRIAAEIRLPEAIDRKLLCPFQYFGVADDIDLQDVHWVSGGYDKGALSKLYTEGKQSLKRADDVINSLLKYVTDINEVKGLGFCVSIEHAKYMSEYFNKKGIASIYLVGRSLDEERRSAKDKLVKGEIKFIFVVDIYNEGVDIPEVNTILFLRPTESLTVFLQQLGRGLRLSENKDCLTVLDFIGQANKKYNFEDKFTALLNCTASSVKNQIESGFDFLPKGCYIQLEKVASEYILKNIKDSYSSGNGMRLRIGTFKDDTGLEPTLTNFLNYYHLDPRYIYKVGTFYGLCNCENNNEDFNKKALYKLSSIDSRRWIKLILKILDGTIDTLMLELSNVEKRMVQMFYATIWDDWYDVKDNFESNVKVRQRFSDMLNDKQFVSETKELLNYKLNEIDFIDEKVDVGFDFALDLHCSYSRNQILVALETKKKFSSSRQGVEWIEDKNVDVFFVTLNKADKEYSPTTMYNDYSIDENYFHWQSQSTTSSTSPTGQRYINHQKRGSKVLLFVREYKNDSIDNVACVYTFLGTVTYVKHEGSRPMNITWKLDRPIPAKFLKTTNRLVIS